jgi:hypothetical protein
MRNEKSRVPGWVVLLGLVPGAVLAIVVLLQGNELSVPTIAQCNAQVVSCVAQFSTERDNALTYGWIGVVVLVLLGPGVILAVALSGVRIGPALEPRQDLVSPATAELPRRGAKAPDRPAVAPGPKRDPHGESRRLGGSANGSLERDRSVLVTACMQVSDLVASDALREQLTDALAEAGVTSIDVPVGEQFDSSRHHAVGMVKTSDKTRHNLVAKTERAGYFDRGRRLRYPDVLVFSAEGVPGNEH